MKDKDKFYMELGEHFKISAERFSDADEQIKYMERRLGREVNKVEARIILAESGRFPELEEDLRQRALKASAEMITEGELFVELTEKKEDENKGEKLQNRGTMLQRAIVMGINRKREGD